MKKCGECRHFKSCRPDNYKEYPACGAFAGLTNFDRITASPEALAEYISYSFRCLKSGLCREGESCTVCIAKWLKQEVEDEE